MSTPPPGQSGDQPKSFPGPAGGGQPGGGYPGEGYPGSGQPGQGGYSGYPSDPNQPQGYPQPGGYPGGPGQPAGYPGQPYPGGPGPGQYGGYPPVPPGYGPGPYDPSAPFGRHPVTGEPYSEKQKLTAGLLQILLGYVGAGRWYLGDTGIALAQLFTCGGLGIWALIDGIMMLTGNVRDKNGLPLRD